MLLYEPVEREYLGALARATCIKEKSGVILGTGTDRFDLLHRLSTGEIGNLKSGQEGTTVLTSEKGRIIDVLRVLALADSAIILLAGNDVEVVRSWLDKYTIMDDFETTDASDDYQVVALHGPNVGFLLQGLFAVPLPENGTLGQVEIEDQVILILRDTGLSGPNGALLVVPSPLSSKVMRLLSGEGCLEISEETRQTLRIEAGRPEFGPELSEEFNPLEAGLVSHVSFTKGCYIGQEVIARLDTYDKVKQRLMGVQFDEIEAGEFNGEGKFIIRESTENEALGRVTSVASSPRYGTIGLGYVRSVWATPELEVVVTLSDDPSRTIAKGRLKILPFS